MRTTTGTSDLQYAELRYVAPHEPDDAKRRGARASGGWRSDPLRAAAPSLPARVLPAGGAIGAASTLSRPPFPSLRPRAIISPNNQKRGNVHEERSSVRSARARGVGPRRGGTAGSTHRSAENGTAGVRPVVRRLPPAAGARGEDLRPSTQQGRRRRR